MTQYEHNNTEGFHPHPIPQMVSSVLRHDLKQPIQQCARCPADVDTVGLIRFTAASAKKLIPERLASHEVRLGNFN